MNKLSVSRFVLIFLALCIFMSGQAMFLSSLPAISMDIEVNEADFDETDGEEDLLVSTFIDVILSGLGFSKMGINQLKFQAVCFSPVAPPPKPA